VCLDADEVEEVLSVDGQRLQQVQVEASFSQPNGGMCQHMLSWARSATGAPPPAPAAEGMLHMGGLHAQGLLPPVAPAPPPQPSARRSFCSRQY
jgi:tRNA (uracil-5-)-methyltransferase